MKLLSVVIAAYDERENVTALVPRLARAIAELPEWHAEVVFVVEGTDGTRERLEGLRSQLPCLKLLWAPRATGLGAAFRRGFAEVASEADAVVTMDADLNHQPEEISRLLLALESARADVVIGSRFVAGAHRKGVPLWKIVLSDFGNAAMRVVFGLKVWDATSGFRAYRAAALRSLAHRNDDFAFLPEILVSATRQGMRIVEEPIHFIYRVEGHSKMALGATAISYLRLLGRRVAG